jgi:hypothetical protein
MKDNDPTKTGVITAACVIGGFAVLSGIAYCMSRQRNPENCLFPNLTDEEHDVEAELVATKSDNEFNHVDSAVASLPPPQKNKHFLEKDEAWERAKYLFPGLVKESDFLFDRRVRTVISELLREKVTELREQDNAQFELLMKRENAVDLCIALGLSETVVRKRYESFPIFSWSSNSSARLEPSFPSNTSFTGLESTIPLVKIRTSWMG